MENKVVIESKIDLQLFSFFSSEELKMLAATAGFRNRLAHDYLDLNVGVALRTMKKILQIYPPYLQRVKKIVSKK